VSVSSAGNNCYLSSSSIHNTNSACYIGNPSSSTNNLDTKKKQRKLQGFLVLVRHAKKKIPRIVLLKAKFWYFFHRLFGEKLFSKKNERFFKYHAGTIDLDLSKEGKKQLRILKKVTKELVDKFKEQGTSSFQVISSPLKRAMKTAQAVREGIEKTGEKVSQINIEPDIKERSWGVANGLTVGETDERFGKELSNDYHDSFVEIDNKKIPGAESLFDLRSKLAKNFIPSLLNTFRSQPKTPENNIPAVFVVSHAGTNKCIIKEFFQEGLLQEIKLGGVILKKNELSKDRIPRLNIPNASPIVLAVYSQNGSLTLEQIQTNNQSGSAS